MDIRSIYENLLPETESDPKFQEHLRRLSSNGLEMLAIAEMAVPLFLLGGRMVLTPESAYEAGRLWQAFAMIAVGALTLAVSRTAWASRNARFVACFSAWAAPTALLAISLWKPAAFLSTDDYIITGISLIVITAAATVPLLPWHALALGLSVEAVYILSCWLAVRWEIPSSYVESEAHHIFLVMVALLATGISATNYQHHRGEYRANQEAIKVAEALTGAQLRAQLAENAISIGKMAATLSHEINSPMGALRSSVETLVAVTDRQIQAPPERRPQLDRTRAELLQSIEESAARIEEVARRLRRFVNLDEAELKSADLNELLTDVTLLYEKELQSHRVQVEFDLEKPPTSLTCRPQLLTAVFSNLLSNAIRAVNGDGRISISTRRHESDVEVTVRDNGRGMPPEEADTVFDPIFKVDGRRVASGNWSLFNTRQMVYEHGGDIRLETAEGHGTAIHVTLPI
jgi:signal transduction histidine kinase